jgi:hypothetical protein
MSYFSKFPVINYSLNDGETSFTVLDIFRRIRADDLNIKTSLAYYTYDVDSTDTPEIVADRIYNDSGLHWIILLTNEIIDPRWDWPMSDQQLIKYTKNKYGITNVYATYQFTNDDGDVVHSSYAGTKYPTSYLQYETDQNEIRRQIKILKPQYVAQFIRSFDGVINNGG